MRKTVTNTSVSPEDWFAAQRKPGESAPTRVFEIGDLFGVLGRSRRLIAMTVATTTVLALAAAILLPARYSASTQLFVDSRGIKILANDASPQLAAESAIADFESQLKILGSGTVMQRVVEREKLSSDPTFIPQPGLLARLRALLPGQQSATQDLSLAAAQILERSVTSRRSERSFVVDVVVSDSDPRRAARLSKAVAEVYLENQLNNRRDLQKRLGGEVTGRLQDLRERVEAAERRLNDFKTANNLVYSGGALVAEQDLTELNNQLNQARARTARAKARLDQLLKLSGNTGTAATAEVLDSPTIVQLRVRLAEANRQAAELRRNLGPLHPDIQAADARVREANSAISGEIDRRRSSIRNDYDQALASERGLARQINDLKNKSNDTGQALIGLRELERAVEANKKVYEEFLLRSRELTEQQGIFANASYIITPAVVPNQRSGLSPLMLLALGFFAGFPIGLGLALVRAQFETRDQTDLRVTSPAAPAARSSPTIGALARNELDEYLSRKCLTRVAVPSDAMSDFAQSVEDALPAGGNMSLLVVSATPHAPGAEVTAALAACWAYEGYEVLAVDADAVQARLSVISDCSGQPGLFDRLHRNVEEFVRWGRKGLPHILPLLDAAQRRDINGARRIVSQRLEDIAAAVDNIVIDAGNLGANDFAQPLCRAATAAIIITDASDVRGKMASQAAARLRQEGVAVIGIVTVTGGQTPAQAVSPSVGLSLFRRKDKARQPSEAAAVTMKGA